MYLHDRFEAREPAVNRRFEWLAGWTGVALAIVACLAVASLVIPGSVAATPLRAKEVATATPGAAQSARFLSLAEQGISDAKRHWWNSKLGWYDERLAKNWDPGKPLARLWDAFPLFEAVDAVAIADPTPSHLAAVRTFAAKAEQYYNPNLQPVGGYDWYINTKRPDEHTYFDDNGWWAIGFLDAYRATGTRRYLHDAELAFRFIAVSGWDPVDGGVWWETLHLHKTSEPLAAEIYVGLALYQITGTSSYLQTAQQFLAWADTNSWNQAQQLYSRNATDPTTLDYVEGMMIGAHLELCELTGEQSYCDQAEQLASASVAEFPYYANWTPGADVIYLRFMLDLYRSDHDIRWYNLVAANADRALAKSRGPAGLFLRRWDGATFPGRLLQTHAATVSLFAWLAAASAPADPLPASTAMPIALTPATLGFTETPLGHSETKDVTITNTSGSPLSVTDAVLGPLEPGDTVNTFSASAAACGTPLAPGQTCQVAVTFTPTATEPVSIALDIESSRSTVTDPQAQIVVNGNAL